MAQSHDIKASRETYEGFIRLVKISTPIIIGITALVLFLLTR